VLARLGRVDEEIHAESLTVNAAQDVHQPRLNAAVIQAAEFMENSNGGTHCLSAFPATLHQIFTIDYLSNGPPRTRTA
jgi:hypothetical protein